MGLSGKCPEPAAADGAERHAVDVGQGRHDGLKESGIQPGRHGLAGFEGLQLPLGRPGKPFREPPGQQTDGLDPVEAA